MIKRVYSIAAGMAIFSFPLALYADQPEGQGPPKPEMLFKQLDKDGDGKLTIKEFVEGTSQLHQKMMVHRRPMGPAFGPGMTPPPMFGMMLPPPMPGMGIPPGDAHGPRSIGPMPLAHGDRSLPESLAARLEALEEKLDAIEAALQSD